LQKKIIKNSLKKDALLAFYVFRCQDYLAGLMPFRFSSDITGGI